MDRAARESDRGNIIKRGIKRVLYGTRVDTNRTQTVLYRKSDGNGCFLFACDLTFTLRETMFTILERRLP